MSASGHRALLQRAFLELKDVQSKLLAAESAMSEPIAIIGMGCRFPGGVNDAESFWRLLKDGVDAITELPAGRWDLEEFYDANPDAPGKMNTRWGGFLDEVDRFDAAFFGIAPREAMWMDPQQRLLLETAWEALEDAGQRRDRLAGSATGVFVGICNADYSRLDEANPAAIDAYSGTGNSFSIAAGRLSYLLDLRGPSVALDTACSSSLVAVHLAVQSLRTRETNLALAGGVNLMLSPLPGIMASKMHVMAPDGRCKTFDARADGYVRGEGCGMVVLKRLSRALADADSIAAVIRGSAVNQDGSSSGLTAPNGLAQQDVIRRALANAGVSPGEIGYVETHGTGTVLGDPIEVEALTAVLGQPRANGDLCALGSVKTNIGHLESAAGIAGLIKVVLSLQRGVVPPHLHFRTLNPNISLEHTPFVIPAEARPWPPLLSGSARRVAGVSSFGWSGTNAHVIAQEPPVREPVREEEAGSAGRVHVLPISAHHPAALRELAKNYESLLAEDRVPLASLCYTAGVRRTHHQHRLAVVGRSASQLAEQLRQERPQPTGSDKLVFVFPGQGSQWFGMGRRLMAEEPVFREALEACAEAMQPHVSWPLLDLLQAVQEPSHWADIEVLQPVIFAVQAALAALWRSWGIVPDAVVGHSMGEIAAAHVAGVLTLDDAARIICRRSHLLMRVRGKGAMAVVELAVAEAQAALEEEAAYVSVAVSNSPRSTVLAGEPEALRRILDRLEARGVFCRWVKVDVASHSPQMDPLRSELLQSLSSLKPQSAMAPFYSTVTGESMDGLSCNAGYWVRNLREPVRFWTAVERLVQTGHSTYLELSPHPILGPAVEEGLLHLEHSGSVLPSLRREEDERAVLLGSLGVLYTMGFPVAWDSLYPAKGTCVKLPRYPWQRERFWLPPAGHVRRKQHEHPLLGEHRALSVPADSHCWQRELELAELPDLADHRVHGSVVFPAAAYFEMVLAAARNIWGDGQHELAETTFHQPLVLRRDAAETLQLVLSTDASGKFTFHCSSRSSTDPWKLHATGDVRRDHRERSMTLSLDEIRSRCDETIAGEQFYRALADQGLEYGPTFRCVAQIWRRNEEALGQLRVLPSALGDQLPPALLDGGMQVLAATLPSGREGAYVPVAVESLRLYGSPHSVEWSHATLRAGNAVDGPLSDESDAMLAGAGFSRSRPDEVRLPQEAACGRLDTLNPAPATYPNQPRPPIGSAERVEGDVRLLDARGQVVVEVLGLRLQRVDTRSSSRESPGDWLYAIEWKLQPLPQNHLISVGPTVRIASVHRFAASLLPDGPPTPAERTVHSGQWLLLADPAGVGARVAQLLEARGESCVLLNGEALLRDSAGSWRGVVMAGVDCGFVVDLIKAVSRGGGPHVPRLWLITENAQAAGRERNVTGLAQSPLWGLSRVIAQEHPEFRCTTVDVSGALDSLAQELLAGGPEDQVALRPEGRYVARLAHWTPGEELRSARVPAGDRPFRVEIAKPGVLDRLTLQESTRRPPGPGEIEIRVRAAGLNFNDVMKAMGIYPGVGEGPVPLGNECAGTIVALGEGVEGFETGDAVVALAPFSFGAYATTTAMLAAPKPVQLSFEQAATLPVAFLTAAYALEHTGRLAAGERVLIHSASGGVGLAAIQLAQEAGAEIFATAGSEEKRAFLRSLGVAHVMDSRSLGFADEVMERTHGQGVDVVLNSLAGEAITKSLAVLAPYGRFLELGKRDLYQNRQLGLWPFRRGLSYSVIDMAGLVEERPLVVGNLLRELVRRFAEASLQPVPHRVFPISEAVSAFRKMAQARHIGKIVLSLEDATVMIALAATLRPDATYLVTGGLGGLGLTVAEWMVSQGARNLVLAGRSTASPAAQTAVELLRKAGARVVVVQADVARRDELARVLDEIERGMPPLRGVIHAAAVLDDGILLQMDRERFAKVMAPKIDGAWNLHALTLDKPLDHFVLFSSAASMLGSPGQGNYAAANAYLDALAHHRRAQGRPALSINWGPWSGVGQAARPDRGGRLEFRGIGSHSPAEGLEMLGYLMRHDATQTAVVRLDVRQWRQFYPKAAESPLLSGLLQEESHPTEGKRREPGMRAVLLAAEAGWRRRALLESHLQEQIGQVLRLDPARIDREIPLTKLGLDSLMALELRNRLEASLGLTLSATLIWGYPTIAALASHLAAKMDVPLEPVIESITEEADVTAVANLSVEETRTLLAAELDDLPDELLRGD